MSAQKVLFNEKVATPRGVYWRSERNQAALRQQLRDLDTRRFKLASIGGDQEQGFEQAFSSLAYSYLKDKAPRLLDFIVGFQLVDRNEDNTKAMGVFGFKVGDQWLYAPVFFLNGDLKGHELLYVKNKDMFVPMKENWVNYLISKKPHQLGEPSDKNTQQLGGLMPNLYKLTYPPLGGKYAAAHPPQVAEWAVPFLPVLGAAATGKMQPRMAKVAEALDLKKWLVTLPMLKAAYEKMYCAYPLMKLGFDRFYGKDFFFKQAQALQAKENSLLSHKEGQSYILPPARSRGKLRSLRDRRYHPDSLIPQKEEEPEKSANAAVTIYTYDGHDVRVKRAANTVDLDSAVTENKPELTEEERERLLHDTVLIKDKRDPHAVSMAYNTQIRLEMMNPTESGLYEILEKPGSFDQMVVILHPHSGRGNENFSLVIRKSDPRSWLNTHRTNLWARQCDCPDKTEFAKYVDGLGSISDLKVGGTYAALHTSGTGTVPFTVEEDYGDGGYKVHWLDHCQYRQGRPEGLPRVDEHTRDWESDYSSWDAKIWINRRKGSNLRSVRGELSIPEDYKIVKLADPPKPGKDEESLIGCCAPAATSESGSEKRPIAPGNLVDVQLAIFEKTAELRVHDTGTAVWLYSPGGPQQLSKQAALISLVWDHGFTENVARDLLKEAAQQALHNQSAKFRVKYAYGYGALQPGPTAPAIPAPYLGMDQVGLDQYPAMYPQEDFLPVDAMSSQLTDPRVYDPFYKPDKNTMQIAQQAAQSGDKEVFDVKSLTGMLKTVSDDNLVNKHLGDLMKALDATGRIYFNLCWHHDEFEDRYGTADMPELIDSVRNTFESVGDLVLYLKEREVGDTDELSSHTGGNAESEPNIDDVAGN